MTLEELLAALTAAKAAVLAAPSDKKLQEVEALAQKAYDEAKAAAEAGGTGGSGEGDDEDEFDEESVDEKTKKYLAKLRKENAAHRTKGKDFKSQLEAEKARNKAILKAAGVSVDEAKPEELLQKSEADKNQLAFRTAILESALEHGIPKGQVDYYEFLITKATNELEEGEELSEEKMAAIVKQVRAMGGTKSATSTVAGGSGTPAPGSSDKVTYAQFLAMGPVAKSKLYIKSPDLYAEYATQAKAQKRLV